jgi:hypothetical protein
MDGKAQAFPGTVFHADSARSDADLARDVRAHYDAYAGIRFLVDVLRAVHALPDPVRTASAFYEAFPPHATMDALEQRHDLRARVVYALTGGPMSLLRRMSPGDLAAQVELLEAEDLPPEERVVRAEQDREHTVAELYLKYLEPTDLCAYLPGRELWAYEARDDWWQHPTSSTRRLMAAQLKSIRRHKILTDTELIDLLGNEVLERDLPLKVRTEIRVASRKAARDRRPFSDTDLFNCLQGDGSGAERDLIDELVVSVELSHLRKLVARAAEVLGLTSDAVAPPVLASTVPAAFTQPAADAKPGFPNFGSSGGEPGKARIAPLQPLAEGSQRPSTPPLGTNVRLRPGSIIPEPTSAGKSPLSVRPGATGEAHTLGTPLEMIEGGVHGSEDAFGHNREHPAKAPEAVAKFNHAEDGNKSENRPRRRRH